MGQPKTTPEHEWLQQLVGEWAYEHACPGEPGGEPVKASGIERVRMLGDLWAVCETSGTTPDTSDEFNATLTIGFDPEIGKFVGNWYCSLMTKMFVYEGELDASRRILTLNTRGPSFTDPKVESEYQDIIELNADGSRTFRSQAKADDGSWTEFMRGEYHRKD